MFAVFLVTTLVIYVVEVCNSEEANSRKFQIIIFVELQKKNYGLCISYGELEKKQILTLVVKNADYRLKFTLTFAA